MDYLSTVGEGRTKWAPQPKWAPARLALSTMVWVIFLLLVLSNIPEGTGEQYQNTSNAISQM